MGQELLGFIVKGPNKLNKKNFPAATRNAEKVINLAQKIVEYLDADDSDEVPRGFKMPEFLADLYENDPDAVRAWAKKDPRKCVSDFVDFWAEPGKFQDATWRPDPDKKTERIVVAGEATWGDEPAGIGYEILRDSLRLGICKAFGIR